jgi:hypothetical protein
MQCIKCGFKNREDSIFCQECGFKTGSGIELGQQAFTPLHKEIEQMVFVPPRKSSSARKALIVAIVIIGGFFLLALIFPQEDSVKKGASPDVSADKSTKTSPTSGFPTYNLSVEEGNLEWQGQDLYFTGILKNYHNKLARNIRIRIDFYKDKDKESLFDTRYVTLDEVASNGAFNFREYVPIHPNYETWWWTAKVEEARY